MGRKKGSEETRRFYDETGWKERDGSSVDRHLFGVKEDGPIRMELHRVHEDRIRSELSQVGDRLRLLECGCGGNPYRPLLDLCSKYVASISPTRHLRWLAPLLPA